jgi:hypothetical protein
MEQVKQLVIGGKKALELYPKADTTWKETLEEAFGKEFFSQKPVDRIKTVEDACNVLGIDPGTVWHNLDQPDEIAYKKLKVVVKALNYLVNGNQLWLPDYNNTREAKWYPWFYMNEPGFRLYDVCYDITHSYLGSRLVFKTEELARYAANQFSGLYSDLFEMQPEVSTEQVSEAPKAITDFRDIKSFEDACKVKGYDPLKVLPNVSVFPEPHQAALTGIAKLFIINEAINYVDNGNNPWVPDWNDEDEEKHYPWADMEVDDNNPACFRLHAVYFDNAYACLGSRLVYISEDGARHAFTQFEGIYKDIFILK